jgi:hypothetical protein
MIEHFNGSPAGKLSAWFSGRMLGIAGACISDEEIAAAPAMLQAQLRAMKNKSLVKMWSAEARVREATTVMDCPAPAPAPRRTADLKFYDGFQLSGVCHHYGQHLWRENDKWVAFREGCFKGVRIAPVQISHDADGPIVALAEDVTYRDEVDSFGFHELHFFARRVVHSPAMDAFLGTYWADGKLRNIHLSIGANITQSHDETQYGRRIQVVTHARLDHCAILEPSKDRPGCGGTFVFAYGRP